MASDVNLLIEDFFKSGSKSFRQGMNYLISRGYGKDEAEKIVREYFISSNPKDTIPERFIGEDIDIEIPLKRS